MSMSHTSRHALSNDDSSCHEDVFDKMLFRPAVCRSDSVKLNKVHYDEGSIAIEFSARLKLKFGSVAFLGEQKQWPKQ